jgi:hypothetical protein
MGGNRAEVAQVGGECQGAAAAPARQRPELLQAAHGPDAGVRMRQHAGEYLRAAGVDPGQQVPCGRQVQVARAGKGGRGGRLIDAAQQGPAHAALGFIQMLDGARPDPGRTLLKALRHSPLFLLQRARGLAARGANHHPDTA